VENISIGTVFRTEARLKWLFWLRRRTNLKWPIREGQVFFFEGVGMGWPVPTGNKNSCREKTTGRPHKRRVWLLVRNVKKCMEKYLVGCALTVTIAQNPPNRSNSPIRATETTIHNSWNWGRFTFTSTFNLDIPLYNFTIVRFFNIFPYISIYFEQTTRLAACVGFL